MATSNWPNRAWNSIVRVSQSTGILAVSLFLAHLAIVSTASAERWMCPDCDAMVERSAAATTLDCQECQGSFSADDLTWYVSHINHRTRDAEVSFLILPGDCEIFRADGLQALDGQGAYWVPWSKVDYYIPRMRLIRLVDGRDLATDYPKGATCTEPPEFIFEIIDPIRLLGSEPREQTKEVESDMAALFVVAGSEEGRDRGVFRFIRDVEAGLHPRLPRTDARALRPNPPSLPKGVSLADVAGKKIVVRVRIADPRQIQQVSVVESSGYPTLDTAAASRARSSGILGAGEMGVPVPATVDFHYTFDGEPTVEVVIPENSIWGDRAVQAAEEQSK